MTTVLALIEAGAKQLAEAGVAFGHGTDNAFDEAAWLVLWRLGLPLDTDLDSEGNRPVAPADAARVATLLIARIETRQPAAYLTREAWLQGVPFYVDQRAIVPRSFIAELLADGGIDPWLGEPSAAPGRPKQASTPSGLRAAAPSLPAQAWTGRRAAASGSDSSSAAHEVASVGAQPLRVLDLCTGNGSLAVLAAMAYPEVQVDAADLSADALEVAAINVTRHQLDARITLIASDGLANVRGPYDLILCNPPYVNARSMARLPAEYRAEPALALDGNMDGGSDGMDFIRRLLAEAPAAMSERAALVLEIGNERAHFEAAFPRLEVVWLATSAGDDQVLLVTRESLLKNVPAPA